MNKKIKTISIHLIIVIVLITSTYFITAQTVSTQDSDTEFFSEYIISVNNIHVAIENIDLALANEDVFTFYTDGEYYYDSALIYTTGGKEQILEAKQLLEKADSKLKEVESNAPNTFFAEDVVNRLEQIEALFLVADDTYALLDYSEKELYEVNYGSDVKAADYHSQYNDRIETTNINLKKLSDIDNKIDLAWDQDWYPEFLE
jgi:hypothetical protein